MSDRFIPLEVLTGSHCGTVPKNLQFGGGAQNIRFYKLELFRLLVGVISFQCTLSGEVINQRVNYSKLPFYYNKNLNPKLGRYLNVDTLLLSKKIITNQNREFYGEILIEYYSYFYEQQKENYTSAFIHLYRILERVAICLPLIYASCSTNYKGVFNEFKKYILDEKIGELKVLDKFVSSFIDPVVLSSTAEIEFPSSGSFWSDGYFKAIEKFQLHSDADYFSCLYIKYEKIISLIIKVRNSYFHALTGANNSYSAHEIFNSQDFFKIINPSCCNWLSYIITQIMRLELSY